MTQLKAFLLGLFQFRTSWTTHYDDLGLTDAYAWGREWAHRLTLRRFEL